MFKDPTLEIIINRNRFGVIFGVYKYINIHFFMPH